MNIKGLLLLLSYAKTVSNLTLNKEIKIMQKWEHTWLAAINAMDENNYIETSSITLIDPDRSAEDLVIKKDLYTKLSPEAKEVVEMVTKRPMKFILFAKSNSNSYLKFRTSRYKLKHIYNKNRRNKYHPSLEKRLRDRNIIQEFFGWSDQTWSRDQQEIREFCF